MPELPEVETFRRRIMDGVQGKTIIDSRLDGIKVLPESLPDPAPSLLGRSILHSERNGKSLFLGLDDGRWLLLHFGMSGEPMLFQTQVPRFARLTLCFQDVNLAICWQRRLGAVALLEDVESYLASKGRGPDALDIGWEAFQGGFRGRRAVKSLLLDQSFVSGVGNLYADEMLFQSRIRPERAAGSLRETEVRTLYESMDRILRLSIDRGTDFDLFPDGMMLKQRRQGAACPRCGRPWCSVKVGGRTSYYCPGCQS